jgi:hypothetical protein
VGWPFVLAHSKIEQFGREIKMGYFRYVAYHLAKELENRDKGGCSKRDVLTNLWNKIWRSNVPRVVKLFLWQACNNVLPPKENLFKRKITSDPLCPVCLLEVETA